MTRSARRSRIVIAACAAAALLVLPPAASAQSWRGWTAYWENDSFQSPLTQSDQAYTNGVRISVAREPQRNFALVDSLGRRWRDTWLVRDGYTDLFTRPVMSLVLGQNFFTPTVITDFDVDPLDRPYTGLLYVGVRLDLTEDPQELGGPLSLTLQHSAEVDAGVMGPPAFGEEVQTGVHVLRTSRIPKGWDDQLGFDPLLQATYMVRARLAASSFFDLTPHAGAMVGNPQTVAYGGATARLGINLSGFPALLVPMNVVGQDERPDFELSVLAGVEGRAFAHNALLDGGLFGEDTLTVSRESLVGDVRLGASLRLIDWRVSYTWVRRSAEVAEGPFGGLDHDYGSLAFSYEPYGTTPGDREGTVLGRVIDGWLGTAFRNVLFEAGLGGGSSDVPGEGDRDGLGMHVAVAKGLLGNRVFLGGEMTGMGREGPVTAPGENHTDEFLKSLLATVRVRPFGASAGPGILHLRAGIGSGTHTLQVLAPLDGRVTTCPPGTVRDDGDGKRCHASESGRALLLGGGYAISLGSQASIGLDLSWNRISLEAGDETFFTPAFTLRYHPHG